MAVINTYSAAFAQFAAENAIETRREKRVMRDADAERAVSDVEKRMMLEQVASAQKQTELTTGIVQQSASVVQNGIQAGQKIADAPEHVRINSDLQSGAAQYGRDHGAALLGTDLGHGQTVEDVLGTDSQGQRIEDDGERHRVASAKLDMIMSGNFDSAEDLQAVGFSESEAQALMGLKERGAGNELTTDEAVEYLFNRSAVVQENAQRDSVNKAVEDILKDVLFKPATLAATVGERAAKEAARDLEEDRGAIQRNRGTQSRMSWLAVEQLSEAGQMVTNKRNNAYKP